MFSANYLQNYSSQRFNVLHADGLGKYAWPLLILGLLEVQCRGHKGQFGKTIVSVHFWELNYHTAFIFHMLIGPGEDMAPFGVKFSRSKVMVTRVTLIKNLTWFLFIILRTVCYKAFIFHICWLVLVCLDINVLVIFYF